VTTQHPREHAEGRAFGPGPRRTAAAVAGALAILVTGLVLFLTRSAGHPPSPFAATNSSATYGGIPSWLPKPRVHVGRVAVASEAHPWLAIEGDTVSVTLARGRTRALLVGPAVPHQGPPLTATTPCTFVLTLAARSGSIPLRQGAFAIDDERGDVHHPRVTASGGGPLPATLRAGRTISVTLRTVLPPGSGEVAWTPAGTRPIVSWDFVVEID